MEEVQEESLPIQMGSGENAKEEEPFTLEEAKQVICTLGAAAGLTMERAMRDNPKIVAFIATKAPSTVKKEEVLAAKLLVNL